VGILQKVFVMQQMLLNFIYRSVVYQLYSYGSMQCYFFRSTSDAYVMITSRGRLQHDGKLGRILEKDKNSCEAYLQLIEDRDIALRVSFDDICEYAGDVESDAMF